jgi:hypothetical protein
VPRRRHTLSRNGKQSSATATEFSVSMMKQQTHLISRTHVENDPWSARSRSSSALLEIVVFNVWWPPGHRNYHIQHPGPSAPWEVHTTTNSGVHRLFLPFEFSKDRLIGRSSAPIRTWKITTMSGTSLQRAWVARHPSWRSHARRNSGLVGAGGAAAATAIGANPAVKGNQR